MLFIMAAAVFFLIALPLGFSLYHDAFCFDKYGALLNIEQVPLECRSVFSSHL